MIDLEKEKQLMINAMRESGVIEIKPNTHQFHEHLKTWCKRAELAQAEITKLKQKLKKLESGEFVLVPKNSRTVVAIENMVWQQVEASGIDEPIHRLDGYRILEAIEEAMIEAVEKDHG